MMSPDSKSQYRPSIEEVSTDRPRPRTKASPRDGAETSESFDAPQNEPAVDDLQPAPDPSLQMSRDRLAAIDASNRARIASALAAYQSTFFLLHSAAAEANVEDSPIPDASIICSHYPLEDLTHVYS